MKKAPHNIGFKSLEFYASDSWKASSKLTLEHNLACVIS
jgi:hypothetical protein